MEGYRGNPWMPVSAGLFTLKNGTNVTIPCHPLPNMPSALTYGASTCAYPLENIANTGDNACALPCPFPVIPFSDLKTIDWAFIIPGIIGFAFSVFVFCDTTWVIFENTNGFGCYDRVRHTWAAKKTSQSSRREGSSADNVMSGNESASTGTYGRRGKVRASVIYALLGSSLGIVYFCIGPLMSLVRFENIACSGVSYYDIKNLTSGAAPLGDNQCQAQRVAPFILQGIFNLMLYALFRVLIMVDQRFKRWTNRQVLTARFLMICYCGLGPFVTLGIAMGLDKTTDDITLLFGQLARNSYICSVRLSPVQEVFLVLLPFVITGIMITGLSLYIYFRLSAIQAGVKELQTHKNKSSDVALRLLMIRLSVLGLLTFAVILILVGTTAYLIDSMQKFSPNFNAWFACETVSGACSATTPCNVLKDRADASSPTYGVFAAQIASMSSISLLLSGFFAAQSFPRLFHEWKTGELQQKFDNVLEGRPLFYNVGQQNGSSVADAAKGSPSPSDPTKRVMPTKVKTVVDESSMAAYMVRSHSDEDKSPVFQHEMRQVAASSGAD
jgi:hypothetical protein